MYRMFLSTLAFALFTSCVAFGQQSLGDIARENQEKKQAEESSGTAPKVITNKDLPHDPDGDEEASEELPANLPARSNYHPAPENMAQQRAAQQWKMRIMAQEDRVRNLQARIDQLNASIRRVGGTVEYEGPYNRYQARQQQRVAQLQMQLDEQKRRLDEMQDAARRAGRQTSIFDP